MKKYAELLLYLLVLAANVVAVYLKDENLRSVTKPLLMPLLGFYFLSKTKLFTHVLKAWVILALIFSWAGDILLMFEAKKPVMFIYGLAAFLLAHVFYIVFFHNIRRREYIHGNALFLLIIVVYYAIMMDILSPYLGTMKLPVRVYGVVISFMLMLAMHTLLGRNKRAGWLMMVGAVLFVFSDSLLAFNKFYSPVQYADVAIMLSYGLAQLLIATGAIDYLENSK